MICARLAAKDPFSQPLSVHCELLWTFSSLKGQERENPHDLPDDLAELLRAGAEHLAKTHLSTSSNRETDLGLRSKQRIPETNEQAHPYWGNAGNTHLGIWNTCNVSCQLNVV